MGLFVPNVVTDMCIYILCTYCDYTAFAHVKKSAGYINWTKVLLTCKDEIY